MKPAEGFLSPDDLERRDHLRRIVSGAAHAADMDLKQLGRRIGYRSSSNFATIMSKGERACIAAADVVVLGRVLGTVPNPIIEDQARADGWRLVREPSSLSTPGEILAGISDALAGVAAVATAGTAALADGVLDPVEARTIQQKIDAARRALAELEGRVAGAVVEPLRRSGR